MSVGRWDKVLVRPHISKACRRPLHVLASLLGLLALTLLTDRGMGAAGDLTSAYPCVACERMISTSIPRYRHARGTLCETCSKVEDRCFLCGLPAVARFAKTADGRFICHFDLETSVLLPDRAEALFRYTKNEVERMLGPTYALKYAITEVTFIDALNKSGGLTTIGVASSIRYVNGAYQHSVELLSGLAVDRFVAACAHEYMHMWINENKRQTPLDKDTIEGICELIAYKYMGRLGKTKEREAILQNTYTRGKIKILVDLEKANGLEYILDWLRRGDAATIASPPKKQPTRFGQGHPVGGMPATSASQTAPAASSQNVADGPIRPEPASNMKRLAQPGDTIVVRTREKVLFSTVVDATETNILFQVEGLTLDTATLTNLVSYSVIAKARPPVPTPIPPPAPSMPPAPVPANNSGDNPPPSVIKTNTVSPRGAPGADILNDIINPSVEKRQRQAGPTATKEYREKYYRALSALTANGYQYIGKPALPNDLGQLPAMITFQKSGETGIENMTPDQILERFGQ